VLHGESAGGAHMGCVLKLIHGTGHADTPIVDRLMQRLDSALITLRLKKTPRLTPRQRYEAALDSSTITPEQRQRAFENAAASPRVGAALDEADHSHERWLKGRESGELRGRPGSRGSSDRP
jgi:hypothetical protein